MKRGYLFSIQLLVFLCVIITVGCHENIPLQDNRIPGETNPTNPNVSDTTNTTDTIKNPIESITANISESISIDISAGGYISWTSPDNFNLYTYPYPCLVSICNLGEMEGLGYITDIPQTGYTTPQTSTTAIACETGHGYVIKFESAVLSSAAPQYVRLYVAESLINASGNTMGKKVQYEYPFDPTELTISKESLFFSKQGTPQQTVTITTKASEWTPICDVPWIIAKKTNKNTLSISTQVNNSQNRKGTIIIEANESRKEIKVEQAAGMYAIGSYYSENGISGVVYKIEEDGIHGMIVSLEEASCVWSTVETVSGCSDIFDGKNNMNKIIGISGWESKFHAFKWCNDFNTGSISGWYLPAQNELNDLYTNRAEVNATLINQEKNPIKPDNYWSSSEVNDNVAWYQDFSTGEILKSTHNKMNAYKVRAVRAF